MHASAIASDSLVDLFLDGMLLEGAVAFPEEHEFWKMPRRIDGEAVTTVSTLDALTAAVTGTAKKFVIISGTITGKTVVKEGTDTSVLLQTSRDGGPFSHSQGLFLLGWASRRLGRVPGMAHSVPSLCLWIPMRSKRTVPEASVAWLIATWPPPS
ncbi:hypothetical protein LshimejAT787_1402610 [Lyophyllum shimeji]|uniref:Uncharacterized protein n=1 Tax=Lyophyllum shimeji TaxID=47721 RepID=A0A9P3UQC1_LYOSH|nr:hypothetical protein LshimejAT787_1402610 [Lyophyllum shimeji]